MKEYTAKELYPEIYAMRPLYECEPGWWRLKWRPLWGQTWRVYRLGSWRRLWECGGFALHWWREDASNGWGRYHKTLRARLVLWKWEFGFWIKWDYRVMAQGPSDVGVKVPLDLPAS